MMLRRLAMVLALAMTLMAPTLAQEHGGPGPGPGGGMQHGMGPGGGGPMMTPEMRQHMMMQMQELLIMAQNTAAWTPQGLVVLQGNRLIFYNPNLILQKTLVLPTPPLPAATTPPPAGGATPPGPGAMPALPPLRSMLTSRLIPADGNGLIVIRGQQVIRIDKNMNIASTVMLPDLPPLTPAEVAAACPMCQHMMMFGGMGGPGMGGPGMGGATGGPGMGGPGMGMGACPMCGRTMTPPPAGGEGATPPPAGEGAEHH